MRVFNPEATYRVETVGRHKITYKKFKNEHSLNLFGNTWANKTRCSVYIVECGHSKNSWHFAR
jgi:hypothetical protein